MPGVSSLRRMAIKRSQAKVIKRSWKRRIADCGERMTSSNRSAKCEKKPFVSLRRASCEISVHASSPWGRSHCADVPCFGGVVIRGYHAWSKREVSKRAQEDQVLAEHR